MPLVRLHLVLSRQSAAGVEEDAALTTHDFDLGSLAVFADAEAFAAEMKPHTDAFCTSLRSMMRGVYTFKEYRWYSLEDGESLFGEPFRVDNVTIAGTENTTSALPPQVAMSVTERTVQRKRWGRFYLCGLTTSNIDAYGRWTSGALGAVANYVDTWYEAARNATGNPSVLSRTPGDAEDPWDAYEITTIQIDDVCDVIRRRRFETTNLRVLRALSTD